MSVASDAGQAVGLAEFAETAALSADGLRELIDLLPAAIYTTDAQGRLTHFKRACITLSGRTSLVRHLEIVLPGRHFDASRRVPDGGGTKGRSRCAGRAGHVERPDGTRIWFEPYPMPLRDSGGRIVGLSICRWTSPTASTWNCDIIEIPRQRLQGFARAQANHLQVGDAQAAHLRVVRVAFCNG